VRSYRQKNPGVDVGRVEDGFQVSVVVPVGV
jgi:hypothetical protein